MTQRKWQFWIDRGGTFTDLVARDPAGNIQVHKLLSENPKHYANSALQGIRNLLGLDPGQPIPARLIDHIRMGTTVATNALLEHKGAPTLLVITKGFADALKIAYQNRPDIFALNIKLPQEIYAEVIEADERITASGEVLTALDTASLRQQMLSVFEQGIRSVAVVLLHGYRFTQHEQQIAELARAIGFSQISVSHQVSPTIKLISRGDTTLIDAYLSPVLHEYIDLIVQEFGGGGNGNGNGNGKKKNEGAALRLDFMQSHGGLAQAGFFQGKDAILSGPAGGIVGAVETSRRAGFDHIIGFDMGGTSTDVCHFDGSYDRVQEAELAGMRVRAPMLNIYTVAAGGGSICELRDGRFCVGPESAGADPGPACYGKGGPLTITDCNLVLGKINAEFFPQVFGPNADRPIDAKIVEEKFNQLQARILEQTDKPMSHAAIAQGFIRIAVDNMANAIKKISTQRGHDISRYVLCSFGGAGGQHACLVADALEIKQILIHPFAGVLSAYGMGLAEQRCLREQSIYQPLDSQTYAQLDRHFSVLLDHARAELVAQGIDAERIEERRLCHLRYPSSETSIAIEYADKETMCEVFAREYQTRFGYLMPDAELLLEAVSVELIGRSELAQDEMAHAKMRHAKMTQEKQRASKEQKVAAINARIKAVLYTDVYFDSRYLGATETASTDTGIQAVSTPLLRRGDLLPGQVVDGPALITEATATTLVEPGWQAQVMTGGELLLERRVLLKRELAIGTQVDPVMLEVFNNLFMACAEEMGVTLANTAYSVNIKERLDFSCAIFDQDGALVANAPHMPVHLGSMGESVAAIIARFGDRAQRGDAYLLNSPYHGGTHLPDMTLVTPVFSAARELLFYVASRAHHADIGGAVPGSIPPHSRHIDEEGILIDGVKVVDRGTLLSDKLEQLFSAARNPKQNIADLQAQMAANAKGVQQLNRMVAHFSLPVVRAYMQHVQDNAQESVRRAISALKPGRFRYQMDNGAAIEVSIDIDRQQRSALIDFNGTSAQQPNNFNAPLAVVKAAVIYVFRTLVESNIPLNAGCLKPLRIEVPQGCMLRPNYPAAVVAGNVETSQYIVDALYGALGVVAASQGTMNNFIFGNEQYQYYETVCGGAGAGPGFDGADAVQTHMTNSRLTDPEILEWRLPVLVREFSIRRGSGGRGRWKGGDGVVRRIEFRQAMQVSILSGHRRIPPYGVAGGEAGQTGNNYWIRNSCEVRPLDACASFDAAAGEQIIIATPGGGGYGPPDNDPGS